MTVRVRFAPSPTGLLHVGNIRMALINWMFAHKNKGVFLLRSDDTDHERSKIEYEEAIKEDLTWLGLTWDEFDRQSARFSRYEEAIDRLKAIGRLYPCYETAEELAFKRKRQLSQGNPPLYDRAALKLSPEDRAAFEKEGRKPHWRFKLNDTPVSWTDLVRGPVHFEPGSLSDPVLIREDGMPLYTLTSVVDDIDHKITHIIRGEDHVSNTAVQIQLFDALREALELPRNSKIDFAHLTLLVDASGHGLSKRLGSLSIASLRNAGIEPMAINSFLARLGTSLPIEPKTSLEEMIETFNMDIFSRVGPKFDQEELLNLNEKLLHILPYRAVKDKLKALGATQISETSWPLIQQNLRILSDAIEWENVCFGTISAPANLEKDYISQALSSLPEAPWDETTWINWTNYLKELTGRKGKALFMPLRQAITGHEHGPEMKTLLPIIGYDRVKNRLENVIK